MHVQKATINAQADVSSRARGPNETKHGNLYLMHMQKSPINAKVDVSSRARGPNETKHEILVLYFFLFRFLHTVKPV